MATGRITLKNVLLAGLVVVMVNLPFVHSTWQEHRVEADGVDAIGTLTDHRRDGDRALLSFEVTAREGQPGFTGTVRVDTAMYQTAVQTGQVELRVLPGSATVWEVPGEVESRLGLVVTLLADLFLLVMVTLLWWYGGRLRSDVVLVATEDLERCPPGGTLEPLDGERYVVCGEVETIEDDAVVLDLGGRRVRVLLAGHRNPAGYQQPVRATGTLQS